MDMHLLVVFLLIGFTNGQFAPAATYPKHDPEPSLDILVQRMNTRFNQQLGELKHRLDEQKTHYDLQIDELKQQVAGHQEELLVEKQRSSDNEKRLDEMSEQLEQFKQLEARLSLLEITTVEINNSGKADIKHAPITEKVSNEKESDNAKLNTVELRRMKTSLRRLQHVESNIASRLNIAESAIKKIGSAGLVMFQASRDILFTGSDTEHTIIPFDDVSLNIGGGYDSNSGIFTAPADGYYLIGHRYVADSSCGAATMHTVMVVNGVNTASLSSSYPNGSAMSGLILLNVGDTIWFSIQSSHPCRTISDYRNSNVYGYLLHEVI